MGKTIYQPKQLQGESVLREVVWQVDRFGRLTPVGIIDPPLQLAGAVVERVTLHNMTWIQERNLSIGSRVIVFRLADADPQIIEVLDEAKHMAGHKGQPDPLSANMIENVSIVNATHVRVRARVEKIAFAWGISPEGRLATRSEGGIGVKTESGEYLEARKVTSFIQEVGTPTPPHPALHPGQDFYEKCYLELRMAPPISEPPSSRRRLVFGYPSCNIDQHDGTN
jgi:hypothetical protein